MKRSTVLLIVLCLGAPTAYASSYQVQVQKYYIGPGAPEFAFGDFNADDFTDLFVLNTDSCTVSLLFGRGDGTFDPPAALTFAGIVNPQLLCGADELRVFDANGDGLDDVAFRSEDVVWIAYNTGSLAWNSGGADYFYCLGWMPPEPATDFGLIHLGGPSDCDGDGDLDLLAFGYRDETGYEHKPYVVPFINTLPAGGFVCEEAISVPSTYWYASPIYGDFDGDGLTDLMMYGGCTLTFCILYGQAECGFVGQGNCYGGMFVYDHVVADFNGDGIDDIFWMSDYPYASVAYGGPTGLGASHPYPYWPQPLGCGWYHAQRTFGGDVNGDGFDDLAIVDCANVLTDHERAAYFQISAGDTFAVCDTLLFPAHEQLAQMAARDLNGDGKDEICYFLSSDTLGVSVTMWPVATVLQSVDARLEDGREVVLTWEVAPEADCSYFTIWRSFDRGSSELIGRVDAEASALSYRFVDNGACARPGATVTYRLEAAESDGSTIVLAFENVTIPEAQFALRQNAPNPFNPATTITFDLPEAGEVWLEVFDVSGRLVRRLIAGEAMGSGVYTKLWEGVNDTGGRVSSGIYYCRLRAGKRTESIKMVMTQ